MEDVLSKAEVAKKLKISERTVDRYRAMGRLKAVQFCRKGRVMFLEQSVAECLAQFEKSRS